MATNDPYIEGAVNLYLEGRASGLRESEEKLLSRSREIERLREKNDQQHARIEKMSDEIESRAYGQEKGAIAFEALRMSVVGKDEALRSAEAWLLTNYIIADAPIVQQIREALAEKGK